MGLRERKKLETRRRLVDVALRRFAEHGYDATTVEEIAADAQVSVTTFFRYFRAKDEVLFIGASSVAPDFGSRLAARPACETDLEAVRQVLREFHVRAVPADDSQRRLLQHRVVAATPVLRGRAHELGARWQREVVAGLSQRHGGHADDRELRFTAAIALAIVSFADDEWCALGGAVDWITVLDDAFESYAQIAARTSRGA